MFNSPSIPSGRAETGRTESKSLGCETTTSCNPLLFRSRVPITGDTVYLRAPSREFHPARAIFAGRRWTGDILNRIWRLVFWSVPTARWQSR